MRRALEVFLGQTGLQVGTLRFEAQGARQAAGFEYHPGWLSSGDRFALAPDLPLVTGMQYHQKARDGSLFHGAIADTEPDGWGRKVILRDHAKQRQRAREASTAVEPRALNALDFLLAVDDTSRVGALRFRDEHQSFQREPEPGRRTAPPLIELGLLLSASRAVEQHTETAADLAYLRGRGTSLGGLRPKCTVIDEEGRLSIGKFPSVQDDRAVTKGEVLALRLATPDEAPRLFVHSTSLAEALDGADTHPAVRSQQARAEAARTNVVLERRNRFPDITVGVGAMQLGNGIESTELMLEVEIPFQQRARRERERESRLLEEAALARMDATLRNVEERGASAWAQWTSARERRGLIENTLLPQADATWQSALASYQVGEVDFGTLLEALNEWQGADLARVDALLDELLGAAAVRAIEGDIR